MLSDDELLNHDASDSILARETPREDSPGTFTCHLINHFGLSSKGGLRLSSIIPNLHSTYNDIHYYCNGIHCYNMCLVQYLHHDYTIIL